MIKIRRPHFIQGTVGMVIIGVVLLAIGGVVWASLGGSGTRSSATDINLQKGLVGYWPMNGNAKDATPYGHDGTLGPATAFAADRHGKAGNALAFNGTTSAHMSDNFINSSSTISVSAWVYATDFNQNAMIMEEEPVNTEWELMLGSGFVIWRGATSSSVVKCALPSNSAWHLITATQSGATAQIYIDGSQCVSHSSTAVGTTGTGANIGWFSRGGGDYYINGAIDDARIYNRVLSAAEVTALYSQYDSNVKTDSGENGLIGWWKLAGNAKDSTPYGNNGTLNNSPTLTTDRKGTIGSAYSFNGTNQYVSVPNFSNKIVGATAMTLTGWVKPPNNPTGPTSYFGVRNDSNADFYILQLQGTNNLECRFRNSSGTTFTAPVVSVTPNVWQMVSLVYTGSSVSCYINAVPGGSLAASGSISALGVNFDIGALYNSPLRYLNGAVNDVRFYNRALSVAELTRLYGSYNSQISVGNLQSGLMGSWAFNGNAYDATPYADNGTVTSATLTTDRKGKTNAAYSFNGTSSQIAIPNSTSLSPTGAMSVSVWFKGVVQDTSYATGGGFVGVVSKDVSTGVTNPPYSIQISNGTVTFNTNNASNVFTSTGASGLLDDTWYHAVGTFDGTTMKLYVNGAFKSSTSQTTLGTTTGLLRIGTQKNGFVRYFNGSIDDVRIWNRALSASEISQLYAEYR